MLGSLYVGRVRLPVYDDGRVDHPDDVDALSIPVKKTSNPTPTANGPRNPVITSRGAASKNASRSSGDISDVQPIQSMANLGSADPARGCKYARRQQVSRFPLSTRETWAGDVAGR